MLLVIQSLSGSGQGKFDSRSLGISKEKTVIICCELHPKRMSDKRKVEANTKKGEQMLLKPNLVSLCAEVVRATDQCYCVVSGITYVKDFFLFLFSLCGSMSIPGLITINTVPEIHSKQLDCYCPKNLGTRLGCNKNLFPPSPSPRVENGTVLFAIRKFL